MQRRISSVVRLQLVHCQRRLAFSTEADVVRSPAAPGSGSSQIVPSLKFFAENDPMPGLQSFIDELEVACI